MMKSGFIALTAIIGGLVFSTAAVSEEKRLLWGDTHLHSSYSPDAFMAGNRDADPDVAYRFAMGLPVIHPYSRSRVQLETPLDFLVVSDHAESMGVFRAADREFFPGYRVERELGWGRHARQLEVLDTPGTHLGILEAPNVATLARLLADRLPATTLQREDETES